MVEEDEIYFSPETLKDMAAAAKTTGIPLDELVHIVAESSRVVLKYAKPPKGKFRVICMDNIGMEKQIVFGDFDSLEQALEEATRLTSLTGESFQVYDDEGYYRGGDYTDNLS